MTDKGPEFRVKAYRCEKVPEAEFDRHKDECLSEGWREDCRKGGFVYIVRDPEFKRQE